ncbi:hypothetical protein JTB14_026961 [Gonioctena quinquepunctata]|nr:hypothetical protein JTB14_026961 [Gonioctena quinquepunctata]
MKQNNQPSCPICENYRNPPAHNCVSENPANSSVLHSLYTEVHFRCKYSKEGCSFVARGWEIKVHERVCAYGLWVCPLQEKFHCSWEIKKNSILPHLQEEHPDELLDGSRMDLVGEEKNGFCPENSVLISQAFSTMFKLTMFFDPKFELLEIMVHHFESSPFKVQHYDFEVFLSNGRNKSSLNFRRRCQPISDVNLKRSKYISIPWDSIKCLRNENVKFDVKIFKKE